MTALHPQYLRFWNAFRLGLVLTLGACGLSGTLSQAVSPDGAWLAYLNGNDLHRHCQNGKPLRFRLVYQAREQQTLHVLDVTGNRTGGALVIHHPIPLIDLTHGEPPREWMRESQSQGLVLSSSDLESVLYWFDRLGIATPSFASPEPIDGMMWLISGCLEGNWFYNAVSPSEPGDGIAVSFQ